jgi:type II secretory pathway pseudopilin PulG
MVKLTYLFKKSLTLMEILVVLIIISILVTVAFINYSGIKEETFDKEAKAMLKLIQAAEKVYKLEVGTYYPGSGSVQDINLINDNLKLSLPTANPNWNYTVYSSGCVMATRNVSGGRSWYLPISQEEPTQTGSCP